MSDEEVRKEFQRLSEKIDAARREAWNKGHLPTFLLLIAIYLIAVSYTHLTLPTTPYV